MYNQNPSGRINNCESNFLCDNHTLQLDEIKISLIAMAISQNYTSISNILSYSF